MTKISNQYSLTNILTADLANSRLGINNVSPTVALDVTGAGKFSGALTAGGKIFTSTSVNDNIIELINSDTTNGYGLYVRAGGTASGRYVARFKNGADADVMWLDKGGNVGIGTTSPSEKLTVTQTTNNSSSVGFFTSASNGTSYGPIILAGTNSSDAALRVYNQAGTLPYLFVRGDGNVGIGTTSISTGYSGGTGSITLQNARAIAFNNASDTFTSTTAGGGITYFTDNNLYIDAKDSTSNMIFRVNTSAERMRITSDGNVGIGNSGESIARLSIKSANVSNGSYGILTRNSSNTLTFYVSNLGNYYFAGTNESDRRVKNNIIQIDSALEKVKLLKPSTFSYIRNKNETRGGFIAQEVKEVFPEFVSRQENEDDIMGVDYNGILAAAVKAIQELSAENTSLINRIEALENK
jgi:uncharacterized protein YneR